MVNTKEITYKKAYTELYGIIKKLPQEDFKKIPTTLINNLKRNMDNSYVWKYDDSKKLEEQEFLVETKALLLEIYERYLCSEEKKEFWKNYDNICIDMIEAKKKEKYNPDDIFKNRNVGVVALGDPTKEISNLPLAVKENIFTKIIKFLKSKLKK